MPPDEMHMLKMMTSGLLYLDVELKEVKVQHHAHAKSVKKQCFNNSYRFLSDHYGKDDRYVLGYVFLHGRLPVEHAWVKTGSTYYDVTLDPKKDDTYWSVVEITREELNEIVVEDGEAPDLNTLNRYARIKERERKDKE